MKKIVLLVITITFVCFAPVLASAEDYGTRSLDLATYLALVERNNPDLLVRFKDIELAETDILMARSALLPHVGLQGGYNRNFTERTQSMAVASTGPGPLIFQDVRTNYDNELTLGIGIRQVLFNHNAVSNYNKTKLAKAIREQSYEAARLAVLCAAKKMYVRTQLSFLVVEIRESSEHLSREQYQRVERRHQVGAATEMDLLLAEVDWRTKTDAVMEARKNAELVLIAFCNLAGISHTEDITLTQELDNLPEIPEIPNLDKVLANRADHRTLILTRDLNDIERKGARNALLPEISASFSYGLGGMGNGSSLIGDYNFNSAIVGITFSLPILNGGTYLARIQAVRLEQEKTNAVLLQSGIVIESELMEIQLRLKDAWQRLESSQRTVETAQRAVALAQTAYSNGQATYLNVADAQDKLDLVRLNRANIFFEYLSAYFDWELAIGK